VAPTAARLGAQQRADGAQERRSDERLGRLRAERPEAVLVQGRAHGPGDRGARVDEDAVEVEQADAGRRRHAEDPTTVG
jgi:hypothetical protein